ncbi:MAG: type II toxin-antitoxin system RelE/ParE family toxin [Proteobacteria bacterium]|nr:type II toxin-antitoxin system RelE/ParE family toxin [Pseudomonadota bacterium]MBU1687067.1 type II toxin-antitoxin system RelE/ParE family toxin [Pseudomonadota bacterium]
MAYRLTNKATDDIIAIFHEGLRLFGIEQAERYHDGMEKVFQLLTQNPELAHERREISPPVRVHPYGAHLIIYRAEQNKDILIIRVRHGHEDWNPSPA